MYISKRSGMDHTVLPANTQCLPLLRKRSPDGATSHTLTTLLCVAIGWLRGTVVRTLVFDQRTSLSISRSTCSWRVTTYVDKPSAIGQPTRPTQPFILLRSINWVVSYIRCVPLVRVVPSGDCLRSKVGMVVWVAGKNCVIPVKTFHSVALRDCLSRKNALNKYLILYFYFTL